ncbi:hypothetical protein [Singulisphaera sp. PoT]|uniref:hypothetical protein n=1 Tax=Singulisphaera sp. PoT TaxID=3411797 RepID=UPI003BF4CC5D
MPAPSPTGRVAAYLSTWEECSRKIDEKRQRRRDLWKAPESLPYPKLPGRVRRRLDRRFFPTLNLDSFDTVCDLPSLWRYLDHSIPRLRLIAELVRGAGGIHDVDPRAFYHLLKKCHHKLIKLRHFESLPVIDAGLREDDAEAFLDELKFAIERADKLPIDRTCTASGQGQVRAAKPLPKDPMIRSTLIDETQEYLDHYIPLLMELESLWDILPDGDDAPFDPSRVSFRDNVRYARLSARFMAGPPPCHLLYDYIDIPPESEWGMPKQDAALDGTKEFSKCRSHPGLNSTVEQVLRVQELHRRLSLSPSEEPEKRVDAEVFRDEETESRDKYIYENCCNGTAYQKIINAVKRQSGWQSIDSVQGIRDAAKRYAERHNLAPPPPRQKGRPPGNSKAK